MHAQPRRLGSRRLPAAGNRAWLLVAAIGVSVLAIVFCHRVAPLLGPAPIAYDTAAVTLYFDRIVSGEVLETRVPTTPKPLLGMLYGPIWEVTRDWRPIVWAAVGAFAAAAGLATVLAWRIAGPAAGLFAGVGLASNPMLLFEAIRGLATPWAVVAWLLAAIAVTSRRPRFAVAGIALMAAMLFRVETLAVVAAAAGVLLLRLGPVRLGRAVPARGSLLLLAMLALPVMLVHDGLLIRDPWYWAQVSGEVAARHPQTDGLAGVVRVVVVLAKELSQIWVICALAIPGVIVLLRRRQYPLVVGLLSLAGGVTAFTLLIGYLGYVVPGRYAAPIVATAVVAAAFAVAWAVDRASAVAPAIRRARTSRPRRWLLLAAAVGTAAAIVLSMPIAPLDRPTLRRARGLAALHGDALAARPALAAALAEPSGDGTEPVLLVPSAVWLQTALELRLPLDRILPVYPGTVLTTAPERPERIVLYLARADRRGVARQLAVDRETRLGSNLLVPILADPERGVWVVRLERGTGRGHASGRRSRVAIREAAGTTR